MKSRSAPIACLAVLISAALCGRIIADDAPATQPESPDAVRLTFLGDRLSSVEASIKATNRALVAAGYTQAEAAVRADNYRKDNTQMDRYGGAPVPWQDFYGKTARSFIMHDKYSPVYYQVQRPAQFDYVYRANNDEQSRARAEIDALGQHVNTLLARRRQLEAEQSSLWATIVFESIQNRDIPQRPLYHYLLKGDPAHTDDNKPADVRLVPFREAVLYLRIVNHDVTQLSDILDSDQDRAYRVLRDSAKQSQDAMQESAEALTDAPSVDPADAKRMTDIVSLTKKMSVLCKNVCESYDLAMEGDAAQDEQRKLTFRAKLQQSLFGIMETAGQLDDSLTQLAEAWNIRPAVGSPSPDKVPDLSMPAPTGIAGAGGAAAAPNAQASPESHADTNVVSIPAAQSPPSAEPADVANPAGGRRINLLSLVDPSKDAMAGHWELNNGILSCPNAVRYDRIQLPYIPPDEYDYRIHFIASGDGGIDLICCAQGRQFTWVQMQAGCGFGLVDGKLWRSNETSRTSDQWYTLNQPHTLTIKVRKNNVESYLDDVIISHVNPAVSDLSLNGQKHLHRQDILGIEMGSDVIKIESAEVIEISGPGRSLR